ncbi:hypothetical protein LKL81_12055 [Bacillus paranthracis]|nr:MULTISPECIES: hypothetical protein [Bacillus]ASZ19434.1 hypothetical protein CK938_23755 [Bacillus cereus]EJR20526.1 hypothetical protein II9_00911 [Bacillus cereus MSX-D12]PNS29095.1 hypothetical protein C1640_28240 [Bacillus sp. AKBS9]KMP16733.1 hypothetical protein TU49_21760 [Bacillus cereus]KMP38982.1 hypothetical protein TU55_25950 [Bacillus cereus]
MVINKNASINYINLKRKNTNILKEEITMNKNKCTLLSKKELLNTNGGKTTFVTTSTNASYYPIKWGKELGRWIGSKIK